VLWLQAENISKTCSGIPDAWFGFKKLLYFCLSIKMKNLLVKIFPVSAVTSSMLKHIVVSLVLVLGLAACDDSSTPFLSKSIEVEPVEIDPVDIDPEIEHLLDSLELKVWEYFVSDPDSAEMMLYYTIDLLDSLNLLQVKFYAYMHLAQLYQYRHPDAYKTINALGKAVRIFVDHPGSYTTNASVYIDIGNIFFRFEFFDEAINMYQLANNISLYSKRTDLQAVALQNIALAYKASKEWDAALHYLNLAAEHITPDMPMHLAQNNNYLAEIGVLTGNDVEVVDLLQYGLNLPDITPINEKEKGAANRNYIYRYEIAANSHRILSQYYFNHGSFALANEYLNKAIALSGQTGSMLLKAKLYIARALQHSPESETDALIRDADSAVYQIFKMNEPSIQQSFADTMLAIFSKRNNLPMQEKYAALSKSVSEYNTRKKAYPDIIKNIMLMASVAAEQAVQNLQVIQLFKNRTIRKQKAFIISIIVFSLLILATLVKIYLQKQKITLAHHAMVQQIKCSMEMKEKQDEVIRMNIDRCNNLEKSIVKLMKKDKPYLNSKLSLSELAGMLNTNQTYLSNFLNRQKNISFTDFINQFRVQEACRQLLLPQNDNLSVDAMATISGFNSKSTFYNAFKKVTGMTPAEFQKSDRKPEMENYFTSDQSRDILHKK
jgi:YesN/AraC family two-component response regulator